MKIIPRYILRHFFPVFALALAAFLGLYLIVDLFEKVGDILEKEPSLAQTLQYFLYKSPLIITQGIPMAALLATLITLGILKRNRELIALRAAGVSPRLYAVPLVLAACFLSIADFGLAEIVARPLNQKAQVIWDLGIRKHQPSVYLAQENVWYRGKKAIFQIHLYDIKRETLEKVSLYYLDTQFRLTERIDSRRIRWQKDHWVAEDGVILRFDGQDYAQEVFSAKALDLPETPEDFATLETVPQELSWLNLFRYVHKVREEGYNSAAYEVELHQRLAMPLTTLILTLLGITIALRQSIHGGIALAVGTGLLLGSVYLAVLQVGSSLAIAGLLPALVGVWAADVIFFALAGYLWLTELH